MILKFIKYCFCDNSDTEDALIADGEDITLLESDIEQLEKNKGSPADSPVEVIIEHPGTSHQQASKLTSAEGQPASTINHPQLQSNFSPVTLKWKKCPSAQNPAQPLLPNTEATHEFEFGKMLIEVSDNPTPYEISNNVSRFEEFLEEIVIPQTLLYSQQKGHCFTTTADKMKALFGMHLVMGYHYLPSLRDYWSSDPDLAISYIANIMPRKRFEELRSFVHFNNNDFMKPHNDPDHDRAFKVRPVLDHCNKSFLATQSTMEHQAIDKHMIKFKGHSILHQ